MEPMTMAAILGGTGLLKGIGPDRWKEDRQRWQAAQTQRYSPWTGLRAGPIEEADPLGSTMQGASTGAALGQNAQMAASQKGLADAQARYMEKMAAIGQPAAAVPVATYGGPMVNSAKDPVGYYSQPNPWKLY